METMESAKEKTMGLTKTWDRKDLARQTSYMGDRYQWIVTKTCVSRAISKEKLTQKGLVSCLDYYLKQHTLKLERNRRVRTRMHGGVRGRFISPYSIV